MADLTLRGSVWVVEPDTNLANLELTTVDITDGSWTLIDINDGIKTQAAEDDAVKITTNAITAGTINIFANAAYSGPRWYKKLTDADGTQVTQTDNFVLFVLHQPLSSSDPSPLGLGCGYCVNPFGTGSNTQNNQGWNGCGVFNDGSNTSTGNDNDFTNVLFAGGASIGASNLDHDSVVRGIISYNNKKGNLTHTISNKTNVTDRAAITYTGSADLYIQVGLGGRYNNVSALEDAEHKQKIQYGLIKLSMEQ